MSSSEKWVIIGAITGVILVLLTALALLFQIGIFGHGDITTPFQTSSNSGSYDNKNLGIGSVSSSSSNENCVIGKWIVDNANPSNIQTWNFYSDGSFKDIHYFSNGGSQAYDWGTWKYIGNNQYLMQLTSTTHTVVCDGNSFTMLADSTGPSHQFHKG